jgi:hypothetical protein
MMAIIALIKQKLIIRRGPIAGQIRVKYVQEMACQIVISNIISATVKKDYFV